MLRISKRYRIAYRILFDLLIKINSKDCKKGRTYPITTAAAKEITQHGFCIAQHAIAVRYNNEIIAVSKAEMIKYNLSPCSHWWYHQTAEYIRENIDEFKKEMPDYDFSEILKGA